jgi:hypothetical protein
MLKEKGGDDESSNHGEQREELLQEFHGTGFQIFTESQKKIFEWKTTGLRCDIPIPFSSVIVSSSFTTSSAMTAAIATAQAKTTLDTVRHQSHFFSHIGESRFFLE